MSSGERIIFRSSAIFSHTSVVFQKTNNQCFPENGHSKPGLDKYYNFAYYLYF